MQGNGRVRIAIGQLRMRWTTAENVEAILAAMNAAAACDAQLCVFPELAVTGFHREIVNLAAPEKVAPYLHRIAAECERLEIAVAVGAPTFDGAGRFNSILLIDERGRLAATIHKNGLTPAEATFFRAGATRESARLRELRCSAVICREVEDHDHVLRQLPPGSVDLVFWPGHMRPDPEKPVQDPPEHVTRAQEMARSLGAFIVQSNWPNALNRPQESAKTGSSAVISAAGELLFTLPQEASGVGVFAIGDRSFEWLPMS